jgi:hypothetical protein
VFREEIGVREIEIEIIKGLAEEMLLLVGPPAPTQLV